MQILVEDNIIVAFADVGDFDNGIEISDSILPDTFTQEFKSGKFKYEGGIVSYNNNYKDEETKQLKNVNISLEDKVKLLEKRITELENSQTPS